MIVNCFKRYFYSVYSISGGYQTLRSTLANKNFPAVYYQSALYQTLVYPNTVRVQQFTKIIIEYQSTFLCFMLEIEMMTS